jgi:hypothetical protein
MIEATESVGVAVLTFGSSTRRADGEATSLYPVLPIGAEVLPGKITVKGGACAIADATGGSALDCDLARRENARHGGRARPGLCRREHRRSVTAGTADLRERAC